MSSRLSDAVHAAEKAFLKDFPRDLNNTDARSILAKFSFLAEAKELDKGVKLLQGGKGKIKSLEKAVQHFVKSSGLGMKPTFLDQSTTSTLRSCDRSVNAAAGLWKQVLAQQFAYFSHLMALLKAESDRGWMVATNMLAAQGVGASHDVEAFLQKQISLAEERLRSLVAYTQVLRNAATPAEREKRFSSCIDSIETAIAWSATSAQRVNGYRGAKQNPLWRVLQEKYAQLEAQSNQLRQFR